MKIPTMNKMIKVYVEAASIERLKCGRPTERTVKNTEAGYRIFRHWLNERRVSLGYERIGMDEDFPLVSIIKPTLIHKYLADLLKSEIKPVTVINCNSSSLVGCIPITRIMDGRSLNFRVSAADQVRRATIVPLQRN